MKNLIRKLGIAVIKLGVKIIKSAEVSVNKDGELTVRVRKEV